MATYRVTDNDARRAIQDIQSKQQQVTDESLESTRRMQGLCVDSTEAGAKTLGLLQCQGEQLNYIECEMNQISVNVTQAEKNLTKMQRCCGLYALPCQKRSSAKDDEAIWKSDGNIGNGKVVSKQPKKGAKKHAEIKSQVYYMERITNDAREDEMEGNIKQVHNMVGDLRNMAVNMGLELEGQNKQIKRINLQAEANTIHIEAVHKRAKDLL